MWERMRETSCGCQLNLGWPELEVETLSSRAREEEILFPLKSPKRWHGGYVGSQFIVAQSHILFLIQKYHNSDYLRAEREGNEESGFSLDKQWHWLKSCWRLKKARDALSLEPGPRLPECIALHDQRPVGTPLSFMPKTSRNQKSGFESCFSIVQTGPFTCLGGPRKEDI